MRMVCITNKTHAVQVNLWKLIRSKVKPKRLSFIFVASIKGVC